MKVTAEKKIWCLEVLQQKNEPCEKIVRDILSKMNINGLDHKSVPIVNCHYVNSAKSQIIARFLIYSD